MTRLDRLALALDELLAAGLVTDWYVYNPGDGKGRRWVVGYGSGMSRAHSTRATEEAVATLKADLDRKRAREALTT